MKKAFLLLLGFGMITALQPLFSQTQGCTDPRANNFNPLAQENDGSCTYNITVYNPPFRFLLPGEVDETSGLIFYNGGYWTMNDSGGEPIIYKLDTITGNVIQRITFTNATNVDWEDITQDSLNIYVGDFGNNSGLRDDLCIYKIKKSDISDTGDDTVPASKISFTYEDYKRPPGKRKYNNFDCEAFFALDDSLYLFSKDWQDQRTRMYRLPNGAGNYVAKKIYDFNSAGLITGADINREAEEVVLIGYTLNSWVPFMWVLFDYKGNRFFSGNKRRIDMLNVTATQTEGICYVNGKKGVISSEGRRLFTQTMYNFSTAAWTDKAYAGVRTQSIKEIKVKLFPNPLEKSKLHILFERAPASEFQLAIFDSSGKQIFVQSYSFKRKDSKPELKIKLPKIKPGVYHVRFMNDSGSFEKSFIKSSHE